MPVTEFGHRPTRGKINLSGLYVLIEQSDHAFLK